MPFWRSLKMFSSIAGPMIKGTASAAYGLGKGIAKSSYPIGKNVAKFGLNMGEGLGKIGYGLATGAAHHPYTALTLGGMGYGAYKFATSGSTWDKKPTMEEMSYGIQQLGTASTGEVSGVTRDLSVLPRNALPLFTKRSNLGAFEQSTSGLVQGLHNGRRS